MTDNSTDARQDSAVIERDIRRTQDDMSRTVDKIGNQLTARNIFNALLDKADDSDVDARMLLDGARRNPIALGLIAAGTIWLISDKDSKFPSVASGNRRESGSDFDDQDLDHRDYVSHMSSVEMRDGEEPLAYQRRRDIARANFLMVERGHDEDESGFRQRLDSMTDKFRETRRAWSKATGEAGAATKQKARLAADKTQELYNSNPLVGGILAAAAGAALGSSLPITRQEQDKLGNIGEKARELASEQTEQIGSTIHEKKDQFVAKAGETLRESSPAQQMATNQEPAQLGSEISRS